jgi:hypothetical protein
MHGINPEIYLGLTVSQGFRQHSLDVPPPINGVEKAVEFVTHIQQVDLKSGHHDGSPITVPVFASDWIGY